jgi:hypothetical protein
VIKFSEDAWASEYSRELVAAVLRTIFAALPARTGGTKASEPFFRTTGDDWVGDVGPAMGWEVHEEFEELRYGTDASGLTVRYVHEYYTPDRKERESREHWARIESYGWDGSVTLSARVDAYVKVYWVLPDDEHAAMLAAWEALKTERGLTVRWPGQAVPV